MATEMRSGLEMPIGSAPMARNTIAHVPGAGTDHGPNTEGHLAHVPTQEEIALISAARLHNLFGQIKDKLFDHCHPVDEYGPQGLPVNATGVGPNQVMLQSDYDMPERITNVTAIIPAGATAAYIQLGQRTLQVYSGAALTTPLLFQLSETGIIINSDDQRVLTITGALTSASYLGLAGYALTRGQFS